jgi:hypothetical protein
MWRNLISYSPNADAGGGSAPDGAQTPPADAGKDWKAEADRKEQLLKDTQAKLKAFEDAQAEREKGLLAEQGKFKELNELLMKEKADIAKEAEELRKFKKSISDAQEAELQELLKGLSDEDKEAVECGADTGKKIALAKRFAASKPPANGGPPVVPGRSKQQPKDAQQEAMKAPTAKEAFGILYKANGKGK